MTIIPIPHDEEFKKILENDIDGLLDPLPKSKPDSSEARLERAFMEIVEFYLDNGRVPSSTTSDIAERKLGARLDGFKADEGKADAVFGLDKFGLLKPDPAPESIRDILENDHFSLLGEDADIYDLSTLPAVEEHIVEAEVAQRKKAKDFDKFAPLFKTTHKQIASGDFVLRPFSGVSTIKLGTFFVLNGIMLFVADIGEAELKYSGGQNRSRERLRVIFENGTESSMYKTSLAIRLGESNGRIVAPADHMLSLGELNEEDIPSGHIYVLQSLSSDPQIKGLKDLHKIGFSTTSVEQRIKNAEKDPTFLMAPVKIVSDYRVYNIRPSALEHLIHRVFAEVRLDITQFDLQGENYKPSEWFLVSTPLIDQAVEMILSGDITDFIYDKSLQRFQWVGK